ncbi:hypothetical protein H5410_056244 [Solanum commersonii]|uniref:Zinc finger protein n=1 Tax=Solanum commersonii TaxID=4109 RepID=A0A9J5WMJ4_SOLCO|nr:hypothetical protein H5410_056244 [Solanum commersonii]
MCRKHIMSKSFSTIKQVRGESIVINPLILFQQKKNNTSIMFHLLFVVFLLVNVATCEDADGRKRGLIPAMFIFGDSLIDNGNNNNLPSFAKANYYPYGIDFDGGPTGRFSNGYTMVDEIVCMWTAEQLGLPLIPAHSEASSGEQMRFGVNYASAAAGILDDTGRNFVGRIPFNQQIKNFEDTLDEITDNLGAPDVAQALAKCIFFVGMGRLMGCIPSILAKSNSNVCSEEVNELILPFTNNVKSMLLTNLNVNLPGSKFIYIDIKNMFQDLLTNYRQYGFSVINRGCCGIGRNRGQITCLPMQTPCPNRDQYIFWDAFHPTEAVNILFARKAFNGGPDVVYPINIHQLATL